MMSSKDFIPARESAFIIRFFALYSKWLTKRNFNNILIANSYNKAAHSKTVYYLNHTMWWDGLIPLLLNEYHFRQKARAIMEDKQMQKHTFFSRIGAFSINLEDPKKTITSLRYALESMNRDQACLFIYPEGELVPISDQKPEFKDGLGWLASKTSDIDYVPIAIYQSFHSNKKPDLLISIGEPTSYDDALSKKDITSAMENHLHKLLIEIRAQSLDTEKHFDKFF